MNRLLFVLALVATVLLGGVAYELHRLNQRLDAAGAATFGFALGAARAADVITTPETNAERRERNYQSVIRSSDDLKWLLNRIEAARPSRSTTRK